ncbi:sigma-w pathway protein ysdB [Lentibacillus saliphilus]|uniref:sigma-w pathway protein ysdB n=1 Tax=Lentibacillus saliphilus TaxID=2737028 RepID=UPI001C2F8FC2|nr:sigma-w pathway protein ysdB [Lentibacillus saliphilus]
MIILLFQMLIFIALIVLFYTILQYFRNPQRKLDLARRSQDFYLLDEPQNNIKNMHFVYKGCYFEGEKYLGTTEDAFEVVNIQVIVREPMELRGLSRDDLYFLEKELLIRYPYAKIEWKHPINQLLIKKDE